MLRFMLIACFGLASLHAGTPEATGSSDLNVVVILDNSGSMAERMPGGGTRIAAAKQALLTVLDQVPANAQVGVLLLNSGQQGRWLVPLGPVDKQSMRSAVGNLSANGGTPLGATMKMASDALLQLREQQRYGTYKLLVVTDGEATDAHLVERYLPEIQSRGLLIDTIGVAMAGEHSLATRTSTYRRADDTESLAKAISAVVLGESSDDSDDTGQSDFDLLASIPSEMAAASLAALTTPQNVPVGEGAFAAANNFDSPQGFTSPPNAPGGGKQGDGLPITTIVFVGIALLMVFRLFNAVGKSR